MVRKLSSSRSAIFCVPRPNDKAIARAIAFNCDLRFLLRRLGYSGGLKNIEKQFNIDREGDLANLSGKDAIKLWYRYKKYSDEKALDTLIRYNIEDIENLKTLMDYSYETMKKNLFL